MMPGELFDSDALRIHDLTVEAPPQPTELPFDFEQEITEVQWRDLSEFCADLSDSRLHDSMVFGAALFVACPTRRSELPIHAPKFTQIAQLLRADMERPKEPNEIVGFNITGAASTKIIFPELYRGLTIEPGKWEWMKDEISREFSNKRTVDAIDSAAMIVIMDPTKRDEVIARVAQHKTDAELLTLRGELLAASRQSFDLLHPFYAIAANLRILNPGLVDRLDLTPKDWDKLHDRLKDALSNAFDSAIQLGYFGTILAAKSVEVTEDGLELNKKPLAIDDQRTPNMPDTRSF
jgi:hypothetical protein